MAPRTKSTDTTPITPKTRSRTRKSVKEPVPVQPEEVVVPEAKVEAVAVDSSSESESASSSDSEHVPTVMERLVEHKNTLKAVMDTLRDECKAIDETMRLHRKEQKPRRRQLDPNRPKRAGSGIVKEVPVSDEFRAFVTKHDLADKHGKTLEPDSLCPSTRGTSFVRDYVKKHDLHDKDNGKRFCPDKTLFKLLDLGTPRQYKKTPKNDKDGTTGTDIPVDAITYARLQTFLTPHFIRTPVAVAATA